MAVDKTLRKKTEIDWGDIRVICIAPGYKKYDLHAVQMMGANIELWEYKLFENGSFYLDEVFRRSSYVTEAIPFNNENKNPVMIAAGKKAAVTRKTGTYTFEKHLQRAKGKLKEIVLLLQSYILEIDNSIKETPKKFYVAYKVTQNFVCIEVKKNKVILFLKINPDTIKDAPTNSRDMRNIGHYGTGDFELAIKTEEDFEQSKKFILLAYKNIGG